MYGTPAGEIPSVGKVELSWIQTPLPPITPLTPSLPVSASSKGGEFGAETAMDEGDAMARPASPVRNHVREVQERNLDYDVADRKSVV